jgi:penicillin-binding protein 2
MVENAGWGAEWATPIATLMMEKYLTDSISRPLLEKKMLEGVIIPKVYQEKMRKDSIAKIVALKAVEEKQE